MLLHTVFQTVINVLNQPNTIHKHPRNGNYTGIDKNEKQNMNKQKSAHKTNSDHFASMTAKNFIYGDK